MNPHLKENLQSGDFVRLNSATDGLEGLPIPNIQQIINRIGTLKPKVFGIIDFIAGYYQTNLHPDSQEYTAVITQYGLYEWTRVAMGLKGSGPFFQRTVVCPIKYSPDMSHAYVKYTSTMF